ncbi:hypothetical protein [Allomesorhizobium alhagi]|uniref:Uncharacterized protein n=1 Tax=Mesorhizobium alhagi CCNWXJ12-2 TaxID=1107882 RepID=H0HXK4_9HYPH|nr:hypothetical protein [Mesorhizobium alhagi]EHK54527.1 hypothetical protein MAXJ12_24647 [Mesorhizobium alhagi CCNWXJ12-2]
MANKYGFQYICTLNTDMVPLKDFSTGFDSNLWSACD